MKKFISTLTTCAFLAGTTLSAADNNTFLDYQNYNHGYCPECSAAPCACGQPAPAPQSCAQQPCDPYDPCAPVCGTQCGVSLSAIAIAVIALGAAAAIIVASGDGGSSSHSHSHSH